MSAENRLESLKRQHEELENAIHKEEKRPHPDEVSLQQMKKEKLHIKDEMSTITQAV